MDIMIKEITIQMRGEPIKACRLCTGQENTAKLIEEILQPELKHSPFEKVKNSKTHDGNVPKYPIFSGVEDPMVQALVGIVTGCNPCPKGVIGSGPKVAYELLQKYPNKLGIMLHETLAEDICKMASSSVRDKATVLCLAQSVLYEKMNGGG